MTLQQTPLSILGCAPAMLTLLDPLTLDSIGRLEEAIGSLFSTFRKDLCRHAGPRDRRDRGQRSGGDPLLVQGRGPSDLTRDRLHAIGSSAKSQVACVAQRDSLTGRRKVSVARATCRSF